MKKKDLVLIGIIAVVALALWGYTYLKRGAGEPPMATPAPTATPIATPIATQPGEVPAATPAPQPTLYPAESYVRVTTANQIYAPIPLVEDGSLKLTQGEGVENVIHVGKNSVYMESATCDNQDCVKQGEVTLENKDTRILSNMIICLPNQVSLELLTPAEAQTALEEINGAR